MMVLRREGERGGGVMLHRENSAGLVRRFDALALAVVLKK